MSSQIQQAIDLIKLSVKNRHITAANLFEIIVDVIESAESFALDGASKKQIVIEVLDALINETVSDVTIANFIKETIPYAIDIVIALSQKKFDINAPKPICGALFCCKK